MIQKIKAVIRKYRLGRDVEGRCVLQHNQTKDVNYYKRKIPAALSQYGPLTSHSLRHECNGASEFYRGALNELIRRGEVVKSNLGDVVFYTNVEEAKASGIPFEVVPQAAIAPKGDPDAE